MESGGGPWPAPRWLRRQTSVAAAAGLVDLAALLLAELLQLKLDPANQRPHPADLLVGGHRLGAGPRLQLDRSADPFAVAQQHVQVAVQLAQVGRVRAEVAAAHAAKPNGHAWPPACTLDGSVQILNGTAI